MIQPAILATVKFYPSSVGGRSGPIIKTIGVIFGYEGEWFDCRILLKEDEVINPGETKMVQIAFLCPQFIKDRLYVGSKFVIRDGRVIAEGIVDKIC